MEIEAQKSKFLFFISSSNDAQHSPQLFLHWFSRLLVERKCGNAELIMFEWAPGSGEQAPNVIVSSVN